ncbi:carbonic anhydrase [Castellaniella sp.]|uniref:carbonic anhydrase n=1 Tax=Castellaniella sp. TaxID=1955812 RepID=UPI002AFDF341|nr:carbonic anhydrase [Castellaniella sp.]
MCNSISCTHAQPVSRRRFLRSSAALALALTASAGIGGLASPTAQAKGLPKPDNDLSPDAAIQRLIEGNQRYVSGVRLRHNFAHERQALAGGQNPYAAILGCADSRVAPEYAFDSARGDLFVARVAGNFANDDMLGSLEYAVAVLEVPAILVLGHEKCGAVGSAVKAVKDHAQFPGHIQSLVTALIPAVQQAGVNRAGLLDAAIEQNVRNSMADLTARSDIIAQAQQAGKLKIAGGIYRLDTGKVDFLI